MFAVDGYKIELHRGDTGVIGITATGYSFGPDDRALFTVRSGNGTVVKQGVYAMEDNRFEVEFTNSDTDTLDSGEYEWDVRYIVDPIYDQQDPTTIIDGAAVATPRDPMPCVLRRTVGQI
jgi:hypothetical protein